MGEIERRVRLEEDDGRKNNESDAGVGEDRRTEKSAGDITATETL